MAGPCNPVRFHLSSWNLHLLVHCRQLFLRARLPVFGFSPIPRRPEERKPWANAYVLSWQEQCWGAPGTPAEATTALRRKWLLPAGSSHRILPRNAEQPGKRREATSFTKSSSPVAAATRSLLPNHLISVKESARAIFFVVKGLILIFHVLLH